MSTTNKSKWRLPRAVRDRFARYRRRWRSVHVQGGFLLALAALTACVGAAVLADRLLRLPSAVRLALLIGTGAGFVALFLRYAVWPLVRPLRDRDVAVRLGRHFPKVEEDLVTAVEFTTNGDSVEGVSPGLVSSALRQIDERSAKIDHRPAVPLRPLWRVCACFLLLAAALQWAYLLRPEAVVNALHRLVLPNDEVPYFSYTRLAIEPGDQVIRTGDPASVRVRVHGRAVKRAYLSALNGGAPLRVALLCERRRASWTSGPLFEDLRYRVRAGDALSQWHSVRVLPPPSLGGKVAIVRDPQYAGGAEHVIEDFGGALHIVQGASVAFRCQPVDRGEAAQFACEGELAFADQRLPLKSDGPAGLVSPFFTPDKSGECQITLTDGFGLESRAPDSVFITVSPDKVPVVTIPRPGRDLLLLQSEQAALEIVATDEFGLRRIELSRRLIARPKDGAESPSRKDPWQHEELKAGGIDTRELTVTTALDVKALGLAPGSVLEYRARASDYADDAVLRRGYSPIYRITVLSDAEHLERILRLLQDRQLQLMRLAYQQKVEAKQTEGLADTATKEPVTEATRKAEQREIELTRDAEKVARSIEDLLPELMRNPSTPTALLAGLERLGRGVRSVAGSEMKQAVQQLANAAAGEQKEQPPMLKSASDKQSSAARRLEQLAQMANRMQRRGLLEMLAMKAERLAARQRELKDRTAQTAVRTVGSPPEDVDKELREVIDHLAASQAAIKSGIDELDEGLRTASTELAFSKPTDAAAAEEGREILKADGAARTAAGISRQLKKNVMFTQLAGQQAVADSLMKVVQTLRKALDTETMQAVAKEIEEFIRRQRETNAAIQGAIDKAAESRPPAALGDEQSILRQDVSEQAAALDWLAREIGMDDSATVRSLTAAAGEMGKGASAPWSSSCRRAKTSSRSAAQCSRDPKAGSRWRPCCC